MSCCGRFFAASNRRFAPMPGLHSLGKGMIMDKGFLGPSGGFVLATLRAWILMASGDGLWQKSARTPGILRRPKGYGGQAASLSGWVPAGQARNALGCLAAMLVVAVLLLSSVPGARAQDRQAVQSASLPDGGWAFPRIERLALSGTMLDRKSVV